MIHASNIVLIAAFVIAPRSVALGTDQNITVLKGDYDYSTKGSGYPQFSQRYNFEIFISGCSWIIDFIEASASTNSDVLEVRTVTSYDGTNIYAVHVQGESAFKKVLGAGSDSRDNLRTAMAYIYPGNYPPPKETVLQNIWLAFASGCTLAGEKGKAKPPFIVDMGIFSDASYSCDYHWTTDEKNRNARTLLFTSSGTSVIRDFTSGELLRQTLSPPFDKGYVTGIGRWLHATNIGGVSLPIDFQFTAFSPQTRGTNSADLIERFTYRCIVTNVQTTNVWQVPAALPTQRVLVCDRRFANRGHAIVSYEITDGKWRGQNDGDLLQAIDNSPKISLKDEALAELGVRRIVATSSRHQSAYSKPGITRIALLLLLAALPIGLFVVRMRGHSMKSTPKP